MNVVQMAIFAFAVVVATVLIGVGAWALMLFAGFSTVVAAALASVAAGVFGVAGALCWVGGAV